MASLVWTGVKVLMESAIAATIPITNISNANPAVVTTGGTAPANGAYVVITATGMPEVNGRVFRVATSATGTFTLDGEDSTLYTLFTGTGSFQVVTLGTSITTATTVTSSGGDFPFIDDTTIHDLQRSQIPSLPNALTYTLDHKKAFTDPGQIAMKAASASQGQRTFKFTFRDGSFFLFRGYVGFSAAPTGQAQGLVTTPSVLTVSKAITEYAA